jgi:hypothetical protein
MGVVSLQFSGGCKATILQPHSEIFNPPRSIRREEVRKVTHEMTLTLDF